MTRINNADGSAIINFDGGCDNMFGCIPSMLQEKASFAEFVMATAAPAN